MIRINLLPVRESRRVEAVKRELALGGLGAALVAGLCGVVFLLLQSQISDMEAQNKQLKDDITNLKTIVARVDEIEVLKKELESKLSVIQQLKQSKTGPVHMLDELSNATPEKLTLTDLQESNGRLTIEGFAVSNEIISQFLSNLEQSEWFDEVYLIEIDQKEGKGYKVKEFSVTARLVLSKGEEATGAAEKDKNSGKAEAAKAGKSG